MKHLGTILILAVLAWTGNEAVSYYNSTRTLEEITLNIDNHRYMNELETSDLNTFKVNSGINQKADDFLPMSVSLEEVNLEMVNLDYEEELENAEHPLLERPMLQEIELNLTNDQYEEEIENADF